MLLITNADNGKTVCVRQGRPILVLLTNAGGPVHTTDSLRSSGTLTPLLGGRTGAVFEAASPGQATITAVISPCGSGPGPHCMLLMLFHVTVTVVP